MLKLEKNREAVASAIVARIEFIEVSRKNRKLVPSEDVDFIIWNLPAVMTCPFRTPSCEKACYARKAERAYPQVLPSRMRNLEISKRDDFVLRMTLTILYIRWKSKKKWLIVRIHESGDFYNKEYAEKWLEIARLCKGENIKFICYTKSFPYFDGVKLPKNFSLRASLWDDTRESMREMAIENNWNIYTAVDHFETGDKFTRCRCKDCATCEKCWQAYKDIRCEIH